MADNHESRISKVETICSSTLPRIEDYMKHGAELRVENARDVATILQKVTSFEEYQRECDKDRAEQAAKLEMADKRIASVEGYQRRQFKFMIVMATMAGYFGKDGGKFIEKITALFQ